VVSTLVFETYRYSEIPGTWVRTPVRPSFFCPFCWTHGHEDQILAIPIESPVSQLHNEATPISIGQVLVELCDLEVEQNFLESKPRLFYYRSDRYDLSTMKDKDERVTSLLV
jgi:hypothetical protein